MKKFLFLGAVISAAVAGCDDAEPACDSGDPNCGDESGETDTEQLLIMAFGRDCEADTNDVFGSKWDYTMNVNGANSGGVVVIDQDTDDPLTGTSEAWREIHNVTDDSVDNPDTADGIDLSLHLEGANADVDPNNPPDFDTNQTPDETTLFQCGMESLMVIRYEIYDAADVNVMTDCVIDSGSETTPQAIWGSDLDGCLDGTTW